MYRDSQGRWVLVLTEEDQAVLIFFGMWLGLELVKLFWPKAANDA